MEDEARKASYPEGGAFLKTEAEDALAAAKADRHTLKGYCVESRYNMIINVQTQQ